MGPSVSNRTKTDELFFYLKENAICCVGLLGTLWLQPVFAHFDGLQTSTLCFPNSARMPPDTCLLASSFSAIALLTRILTRARNMFPCAGSV